MKQILDWKPGKVIGLRTVEPESEGYAVVRCDRCGSMTFPDRSEHTQEECDFEIVQQVMTN